MVGKLQENLMRDTGPSTNCGRIANTFSLRKAHSRVRILLETINILIIVSLIDISYKVFIQEQFCE